MAIEPSFVIKLVELPCPDGVELIAGHGFFSPLTVEDLFRAVALSAPSSSFGLAIVEGSSGLIRRAGNNADLIERASSHALSVAAGHFFVILLKGAYPLQVVNTVKQLPSVVCLYCATGNPVSLVVVDIGSGSAVLGAVDGGRATSKENGEDIVERRSLLRKIGYLESDPSR